MSEVISIGSSRSHRRWFADRPRHARPILTSSADPASRMGWQPPRPGQEEERERRRGVIGAWQPVWRGRGSHGNLNRMLAWVLLLGRGVRRRGTGARGGESGNQHCDGNSGHAVIFLGTHPRPPATGWVARVQDKNWKEAAVLSRLSVQNRHHRTDESRNPQHSGCARLQEETGLASLRRLRVALHVDKASGNPDHAEKRRADV